MPPVKPRERVPSWVGKEILSTKEAAEYLGVSSKTLERYRALNVGPPYRRATPKSRAFYSLRALRRWSDEIDQAALERRSA